MKSTRARVRTLLKRSKHYRNHNKLLTLEILREYGLILTAEQEQAFMLAPSVETILRRRREFESLYPSDLSVTEHKDEKARKYRDYYGSFWKRWAKRKIKEIA